VGCCWLLTALLFVGGVMNLFWVALIAILVLGEKVMPRGDLFGKAGGMVMIALTAYMVLPGSLFS
jgi:predicted metal-binding membrane protein